MAPHSIGGLVVMGGGIAGTNVALHAEFNVWSDAETAHRVFAERPVMVPIDLTRRCAANGAWLESLTGEVGATLAGLTTRYHEFYREAISILVHDAVAEAIKPGILTARRHLLDVDTSDGDEHGAGAFLVDVAEDTDVETLQDFLRQRLSE